MVSGYKQLVLRIHRNVELVLGHYYRHQAQPKYHHLLPPGPEGWQQHEVQRERLHALQRLRALPACVPGRGATRKPLQIQFIIKYCKG